MLADSIRGIIPWGNMLKDAEKPNFGEGPEEDGLLY